MSGRYKATTSREDAGHQGLVERATMQRLFENGPLSRLRSRLNVRDAQVHCYKSIEWARAETSRKGSAKSKPTGSLKSFEFTDRSSGLVQRLLEKGRLDLNLQVRSCTLSLQVDRVGSCKDFSKRSAM